MKSPVASLFLLTSVTLLAAITPAKTTHQRVSKSTPSKPRSTTVKICQGLPVPPGYIITAYITTSSCPHGAYVITKQHITDPASSLAANKDEAADSDSPVTVNKKQNNESENSVPAKKKRSSGSRRSAAVNRGVRQPAGTATRASRPRRVGTEQPETDVASLSGTETTPEPSQPRLTGITPVGTAVKWSAHGEPTPGPEKVGEGEGIP